MSASYSKPSKHICPKCNTLKENFMWTGKQGIMCHDCFHAMLEEKDYELIKVYDRDEDVR